MFFNGKPLFAFLSIDAEGLGSAGGAIDLANIPVVDSIENPTESSPSAVKYNGEIYLLVEE